MVSQFGNPLPEKTAKLGYAIVSAMQQEALRFAMTPPVIRLQDAIFSNLTDPVNGQPSFEGVWRNQRNERCGSMTFNSDGSCYAEYDIFCPHPNDARWFVEMITAWGSEGAVRCEAQLIPSLEEAAK